MINTTLSFHMSNNRYCIAHNFRELPIQEFSHIDPEASKNNIYYRKYNSVEEMYNYIFEDSYQKWQASKSPSQRLPFASYYEKILTEEKRGTAKLNPHEPRPKNVRFPHVMYETIVTIGNYNTKDLDEQTQLAIIQDYLAQFEKSNPNIELFGYAIHRDEAKAGERCHVHINYTFKALTEKRGWVNSQNKALEQMGYFTDKEKTNGVFKTNLIKWQDKQREILTEIAKNYEVNIVKSDKVLTNNVIIDNYRIYMQAKNLQEQIQLLSKRADGIKLKEEALERYLNESELNDSVLLVGNLIKLQDENEELKKDIGSIYNNINMSFECEKNYLINTIENSVSSIAYETKYLFQQVGDDIFKEVDKAFSRYIAVIDIISNIISITDNIDSLLSSYNDFKKIKTNKDLKDMSSRLIDNVNQTSILIQKSLEKYNERNEEIYESR